MQNFQHFTNYYTKYIIRLHKFSTLYQQAHLNNTIGNINKRATGPGALTSFIKIANSEHTCSGELKRKKKKKKNHSRDKTRGP